LKNDAVKGKDQTMYAVRWFAVLLLAAAFGLGCSERRPDTDPTDSELQVPTIDEGKSETGDKSS
jgi:hypothetical protein